MAKIQSRRWVWIVLALTLALILFIGYQRLLDARPQPPRVTLTRGPYLQSVTPDGVTMVWETDIPGDSRVDYGPSTSPRFSVKSSEPVTRHVLTLTGLEPYTMVHYRVFTNRWPLWNEGTFRTAATPSQTVFSFAVFGDTRSNPIAHQQVVSSVLALAPDLVLHTGDYVENGLIPENWTTFFTVEQKLLSQTPLYGVMGNHESDSPLYLDAFYFPGNKLWYSFDYGNIHFVALYAEKATPEEDPWLANDLAQTRQPWKVVFLHYPLYSSGEHGGEAALRKQLEPVFIKYGVDLVLCGHDHDYERLVVKDIVYIVAGGGGAPLYPAEHPDPNSAYFTSTHSSVHIAVDGLQLNIAAVRSDGVQFDPFALRKASPADRAVVIR